MNIDINLLPEELKPKPPMKKSTFLLIILVIALAYGAYFQFTQKSEIEDENEDLEVRIANLENDRSKIENEISAFDANPENINLATELSESIAQFDEEIADMSSRISAIETINGDYKYYSEYKIEWGKILDRVYELVPPGLSIATITQSEYSSNILNITGLVTIYNQETTYGAALDNEPNLLLLGVPQLIELGSDEGFSLSIQVLVGGETW